MTAFVLVSGMFTGPQVWAETAERLSGAGARVCAVALTGLGEGAESPGAGVDLETHVADVLRAIDAIGPAGETCGGDGREAGEGACRGIVLVGHDYGIHPALAAADRRRERVARVVYLDSGLPQDGVPALAAVPDRALREELAARAAAPARDGSGVLAAPDRDGWQRWGSTEGLGGAALDRLTALASPHPLGTLSQPLRLTHPVGTVPTTGVLCTGSGTTVETVRMLVGFGDPAMRFLTGPEVTFFELATGHWPMLSAPAELAGVLLRAAAGGGRRLGPVTPAHLRPFLLDVPRVPRERSGNTDLYAPEGDARCPAVVFVHGGPVPADARPTPRDWTTLKGYARLAADQGVVGVTVDHRLHSLADYPRAADDVADAVRRVRAHPRVDGERIAVWFFSGGGLLAADWLGAPPSWLRCLAATYPVLAPLPAWGPFDGRFRPSEAVAGAGALPVVLTRVGLESPGIAATVEEFMAAAGACGKEIEVVDVPEGHHGFETLDPTDASREAVLRAMRSVVARLRA
ncbi:alpha/beta hydrolase [Streptomyces nitrosporeus]|uniref:alpha/beta hydrolase n=1 Tax=Streptomyces nitrosporeus TaxID=28894 RepID=UPI0033180B67